MIVEHQLNPKLYPTECWFNVYSNGQGFKYSTRDNCEEAAFYAVLARPLYRIHVRLK